MITFNNLKRYALSGRNSNIGKPQAQWRFKYEPEFNMIKIYHRGYTATRNDTDSAMLLFSITSDSKCQIHVPTNFIDQVFTNFARRELNLKFELIPYAQRHKFRGLMFIVNGYYYITDMVTINLFTGKAVKAPSYSTEEIDKSFNQLITNCSKIFRHEFTATYNLLHSSMSLDDMISKGNLLSDAELWINLTEEKLSAQLIYNWLYTTKEYKYRFQQNFDRENIDIRKLLQTVINDRRIIWAEQENKMVYTVHEQ